MPLQLSGTSGVLDNSGAFIRATAVASTSGTSIDFTSIPSWVKRITVMLNAVSTNGTSIIQVQLGTSGGVQTTSYNGNSTSTSGGAIGTTGYTTGFALRTGNASSSLYGSFIISLLNSNNWVCQGIISDPAISYQIFTSGGVTLGGTLDRVRITSGNGTDTFDAGSINILYE